MKSFTLILLICVVVTVVSSRFIQVTEVEDNGNIKIISGTDGDRKSTKNVEEGSYHPVVHAIVSGRNGDRTSAKNSEEGSLKENGHYPVAPAFVVQKMKLGWCSDWACEIECGLAGYNNGKCNPLKDGYCLCW